ncbi:MAG: efflux RND transporter periplasmic adaptor subunit [Mariprofundaceae bacterium]|nr:efflux RND transporter periplasmic adaptor subunit [Mariprofundaceae bacterium]
MRIHKKQSCHRPIYWALIALLSLSACGEKETATVHVNPIHTQVAHHLELHLQDVATHYITSGTVASDHRVSISSRLSGYIRDMKVREGDRVQAGQVLLHIDAVHAKQALVQAKADLNNAQADLTRYKSLLKQGAVTSQQFDTVKLRYDVAKSQVKQAKHALSYAKVLSPVNGVVVEKRMAQGDLASAGMPILTLEDPSSLLVQTYVSELYVGKIHEGDRVDVVIASLKQHFQGIVRQVVQAADLVSHQFLVKISLPSVVDIHPGMYAQTGFQTGVRPTLLIPKDAIVSQQGLHGVYVKDAHAIVHYRLIRVGQKIAAKWESLAGLQAGDILVWGGKPALKTGMKVQP